MAVKISGYIGKMRRNRFRLSLHFSIDIFSLFLVDKIGTYAAIVGRSFASNAEKRLAKSSVGGAQTFHDVVQVATAGVAGKQETSLR